MTESTSLGDDQEAIVSSLINHVFLVWTHWIVQSDIHCEFPFEKLLISVYLLVG